MLHRCHTRAVKWPRSSSLVPSFFPASFLPPLLTIFLTFQTSFLPSVLWKNSIQAGIRSTRPARRNFSTSSPNSNHCGQHSQPKDKMDSMPPLTLIPTIPIPNLDLLKIAEPETKTQHVEHVNAPAAVEHQEHLPSGLSQTEEEKAGHWFIGSIDCGTTSSRFLIFDGEGTPVSSHQIEFENIYPESGWVESRRALYLGANDLQMA